MIRDIENLLPAVICTNCKTIYVATTAPVSSVFAGDTGYCLVCGQYWKPDFPMSVESGYVGAYSHSFLDVAGEGEYPNWDTETEWCDCCIHKEEGLCPNCSNHCNYKYKVVEEKADDSPTKIEIIEV